LQEERRGNQITTRPKERGMERGWGGERWGKDEVLNEGQEWERKSRRDVSVEKP
jgi:hypothetical protein